MTIRYWRCHYLLPVAIKNDVLSLEWVAGVIVEDSPAVTVGLATSDMQVIDASMLDMETGHPVGITFDSCIDRFCNRDDCGPLTLIAEVTQNE